METTAGWWNCGGCDVDVEMGDGDVPGELARCHLPCPDCGVAMSQWRHWDNAA